jgi:hypothetical protein
MRLAPLPFAAPHDPPWARSIKNLFGDADRQGILRRIDSLGPASERIRSFPGRLTGDERGRMMYRHLDHHLRPFGA